MKFKRTLNVKGGDLSLNLKWLEQDQVHLKEKLKKVKRDHSLGNQDRKNNQRIINATTVLMSLPT